MSRNLPQDKVAKTVIVILAAGNSSRMDGNKQLLDIGGQNLLNSTIHAALNSNADNLLVVLGHNAKDIQKTMSSDVQHAINPNWQKGMGNSCKMGLREALNLFTDMENVIIAVCDQPFLSSDILNQLIMKKAQDKTIIASKYQNGVFGVPALFGKRHFDDILKIPDNKGAKILIDPNKNHVDLIDFDKGIIDIDTPEDLNKLKNLKN